MGTNIIQSNGGYIPKLHTPALPQFSDMDIGITMNLYVHVTEEEKLKEMENIQESLNVAV